MQKHIKVIDTLLKLAEDSSDENGCKANHAACIVSRNTIVSFGFNQRKTHPFQAKYGKNDEAIYWHAESNAIHNALKRISKEDLARSVLYVVRVKSDEDDHSKVIPAISKPCEGCMRAIRDYGIREVIYTEDSEQELIYSTITKR
jgi:deoxycytidylate deaminase